MRRWIFILLFSVSITWLSLPVSAASSRQVITDPVEYTFGDQVILRASIDSDIKIREVRAFIHSIGDPETYTGTAVLQDGQIKYRHDLTTEPLRAFSQVEYWFLLTPQTGASFLSNTFTFYYEDNRFDWQVHSSESFILHWYEGDFDFAQNILNAAEAGLVRASRMLVLPSIQPVNIYVYASGLEMQSTLRLGGLRWIAGHADPDLGVAVVSLPAGPDQRSEIERQIPHEVMHLLLYQSVGQAYYTLPTWLKEGLASANEMRPNSDYYVILSNAVEEDALIPMASLCQSFPQDNTVYLAYAQSDSFIRYLYQQVGQTGLQNLVDSYSSGAGCENASLPVFGMSLSELEQQWRRTALNDNVLGLALEALLPWSFLLLGIILVPLGMLLAGRRRSANPQSEEQTRKV
jgi:hypothetical protein